MGTAFDYRKNRSKYVVIEYVVIEIIKTIKDSDTVIERDMKLLTLFFELFRLKPYQRFSALLMKKVAETATSCVYRKTADI